MINGLHLWTFSKSVVAQMETCEHILETVSVYEIIPTIHHIHKQLRTWPEGGTTAQLCDAVHWEYHLLRAAVLCYRKLIMVKEV